MTFLYNQLSFLFHIALLRFFEKIKQNAATLYFVVKSQKYEYYDNSKCLMFFFPKKNSIHIVI